MYKNLTHHVNELITLNSLLAERSFKAVLSSIQGTVSQKAPLARQKKRRKVPNLLINKITLRIVDLFNQQCNNLHRNA